MEKKIVPFLAFFLLLSAVSDSRTIDRRSLQKDGSSGYGEIPLSINPLDDRRFEYGPEKWNPPTGHDRTGEEYEYDSGVGVVETHVKPSDYDHETPGEDGNGRDNLRPGIHPEKFPSDEDHDESPIGKPVEEDETIHKNHETGDDDYHDGEDDSDNSIHHGEDSGLPVDKDEDKSIHKDEGLDGKEPESDDAKDHHVPDDEEKKEDDEKSDEYDNNFNHKDGVDDEDDKDHHVPEDEHKDHEPSDDEKKDEKFDEHDENDDEDEVHGGKELGISSEGSIFDTPFFNFEQVKKYFGQLDRALEHVFRQTLEEALLMNGTFANTTEEEVEINGKKYIVHKSLITGADNHSSIYVEALSTKPKLNDTVGLKDVEAKNSTEV